jgi:hypothetical protein
VIDDESMVKTRTNTCLSETSGVPSVIRCSVVKPEASRTTVLWTGTVVLWYYGIVVLRYWGTVVLGYCGIGVLRYCGTGTTVLWYCGLVLRYCHWHAKVYTVT